MAKDKTGTIKPCRIPATRNKTIFSSKGKRGVVARRRPWEPADISVEFTPPDSLQEAELQVVEAFLKKQLNEILHEGKVLINKSKRKER